jgi:hypothetical protein
MVHESGWKPLPVTSILIEFVEEIETEAVAEHEVWPDPP